jgi:hypothetical protein
MEEDIKALNGRKSIKKNMVNVSVSGRIILKYILEERVVTLPVTFFWFTTGISSRMIRADFKS